jgi:CheY-like chemotaxis protein
MGIMVSKTPARLLLVGRDRSLTYTRRLLLERQGFEILEVETDPEAVRLVATLGIQGVVICHTLGLADQSSLTSDLRRVQPHIAITSLVEGDCQPTKILTWAKSMF